jgi:hypothetical protein
MAVISRVEILIDGSQPVRELNKVSAAAGRTANAGTKAANKINASFQQLGTRLGKLKTAFSSLGAAVTSIGLTAKSARQGLKRREQRIGSSSSPVVLKKRQIYNKLQPMQRNSSDWAN